MPNPETTTARLRWVEHDPTFHSLMLGRIELAQLSQGSSSGHWFYSLRFADLGERCTHSLQDRAEAEALCEAHARKVLYQDNTTTNPSLQIFPDKLHPNDWRVEHTDADGEGGCEVAIFSGQRAEERARWYAGVVYGVETLPCNS